MRKILLFLLFGTVFSMAKMAAQPTFSMPSQQLVNQGEMVCVPITVIDFTDILSVQFSINWDQGVLQYNSVANFNALVPGLGIANFDVSQAANGVLTFSWDNGEDCLTSLNGVTINEQMDDDVLFEVCFIATGSFGGHTDVKITDNPVERFVTRENANCNDIGEFVNNGFVSIDVLPLKIIASSVNGNTGETVCVDFSVEDFDQILSMQFSVNWDPTILEFSSSVPSTLPNFANGSTVSLNDTDLGIVTVSWFDFNNGLSIPDGSQILQLCFTVLGECGQSSSIETTGIPTPIEVTTGPSNGKDIGLFSQDGLVNVNCFNPDGITINIPDTVVCPGETFAVDVTVADFQNIAELHFSMNWNSNVIQLTNVSDLNSNLIFFDVNNTPSNLTADWSSQFNVGNLNDGSLLFRLHFLVVGAGGSNSTISVVGNPVPIFVSKIGDANTNIGVNSNNGLVTVKSLTGITVNSQILEANPGEIVCIDFTVQDFDNIVSTAYTISWEPAVLSFVNAGAFGLPGMTDANFSETIPGSGFLCVDWQDPSGAGVTMFNGAKIFELCFQVVGDPLQCSDIVVGDTPCAEDIVSTTSNGTNIGLHSQAGSVCVLNSLGFTTNIPNIFAAPGSQTCVDFTVENFTQLTMMQYSINWDPTILEFDTINNTGNLPGFSNGSYNADVLLTEDGKLTISWTAPNFVQGETVSDGTPIFELCFNVIGGNAGDCSPVIISQDPLPVEITTATTGSSNVGIIAEAGSICVSESIQVIDTLITNVDCPGSTTGAIDITTQGGSGIYTFNWSGPGIVNPLLEDQTGLTNGTYSVTIVDATQPAINTQVEIVVGISPNAAVANAGQDTTFGCNSFILILDGSASSGPPGTTFLWEPAVGNGLVVGGANTLAPTVVGGSCFQLTASVPNSGCVTKDTVCIAAAQTPGVEAGPSVAVQCNPNMALLDGTGSSTGFNAQWTTSTGSIVPGTENSLTPAVTQPGWYFLTLTDFGSGCSKTDSVFVTADTIPPISNAGTNQMLDCNDDSVALNGGGSSIGPNFRYDWTAISSGAVCGDTSAINTQACQGGSYQLMVTDTTNGCVAFDSVLVMQDTLKPTAVVGTAPELTCLLTSVILDGTASSLGDTIAFQWNTLDGNITGGATTTLAQIDAAGTYTLTVTNTNNGCSAISTIQVTQNTTPPESNAGEDAQLSCSTSELELNGHGSSAFGPVSFEWFDANNNSAGSDSTLLITSPGSYSLVVTDSTNGCTATDVVEVLESTDAPPSEAGQGSDFTCNVDAIVLQGSTDPNNPNLQIQWSGPGPVGCIAAGTSTTLTPTVFCPGTYSMLVFDTLNGCSSFDTVVIGENMTSPEIAIAEPASLTCVQNSVQLSANTDIADFTADWVSVPAMLPITGGNTLTPEVTEPGSYVLQITNTETGCFGTSSVLVAADTIPPVADAGADGEADCLNPIATLDASASSLENTSLEWIPVQGSINPDSVNNTMVEAETGIYELLVTNIGNGCTARDTAEVVNVSVLPGVEAGDDVVKSCDQDAVQLDGSASETGPSISYQWTNENGEMIGGDTTVILVQQPGLYFLTVFDSTTACSVIDSVAVSLNINLENASAVIDADQCSDLATLIGNLPANATGMWTSSTGASIQNPDSSLTEASNLMQGVNEFIWTLSSGTCVNFSADTLRLFVNQTAPLANNDLRLIPLGSNDSSIIINTQANDFLNGAEVVFDTLSAPTVGVVEIADQSKGILLYKPVPGISGDVRITYELCNRTCPDLCDDAVVILTFEVDPNAPKPKAPNGITPNGDGLNDAFVFDELLNPESFPDNEIVIFNRWGDVVFSAKPYLNDWKGTNKSGKDLPQGTYYYILRLNLAQSKIIRGDITILK